MDVPNSDLKLDIIKVKNRTPFQCESREYLVSDLTILYVVRLQIRGRQSCVDEAKTAILKRKKEIDNGREEWELRSFEIKVSLERRSARSVIEFDNHEVIFYRLI